MKMVTEGDKGGESKRNRRRRDYTMEKEQRK